MLTVTLLAIGAAYAFRTLYAAMTEQHTRIRVEGADQFVVSNPAAVRPPPGAYDVFARDDSIWRARNAPRVSWWSLEEGPYVWHKPPRQTVTDSAYDLTRSGRVREAAVVLDSWLDAHPADADLLLEVARLRNSLGETDAAVRRYRQLLTLRPSESARSELAGALLGAERYGDAATEYRALLALRPDDRDYRLGLARAYVWGDHGRDAEELLHAIAVAT
ncbi:MAG TPA: tetratricopeptide repeat protein, partial [Gemmatimonadaceae bacterium]